MVRRQAAPHRRRACAWRSRTGAAAVPGLGTRWQTSGGTPARRIRRPSRTGHSGWGQSKLVPPTPPSDVSTVVWGQKKLDSGTWV